MKTLLLRLTLGGLLAITVTAAVAAGKADKSSDASSPKAPPASADQAPVTAAPGAQDARAQIKDWGQGSQSAAEAMLDRYGQPDAVSAMMLVWKDKTPFTRIVVFRDPIRHLFPIEHQDVLLQEVSLQVPIDKVGELARFDGSILIDRTKGTVAARCDRERNNLLALNLANEIITGKRDSDSARRFYADTVARQLSGKSSPYADKLMFGASATPIGDPDHSVLHDAETTGAPDGQAVPPQPEKPNPGQ